MTAAYAPPREDGMKPWVRESYHFGGKCGCDHDLTTDGCGLCRNRMRLCLYREERRAS